MHFLLNSPRVKQFQQLCNWRQFAQLLYNDEQFGKKNKLNRLNHCMCTVRSAKRSNLSCFSEPSVNSHASMKWSNNQGEWSNNQNIAIKFTLEIETVLCGLRKKCAFGRFVWSAAPLLRKFHYFAACE